MRIVFLRYFFFFLFLPIALLTQAQEFQVNVTHYGVEDGLSHREVNAIFQDRDGFLWMGTRFGLNRFDGYNFKSWNKDKKGNDFNNISRIAQDDENLLWLFMGTPAGTPDTIILLNPYNGNVTSLQEKFGSTVPFQVSNLSKTMITTKDGLFFFGTKNKASLIRYESETGFKVLELADFQIFEPTAYSDQQTIWGIADYNKVVELSQNGEVLQLFEHDKKLDANSCFLQKDTFWFVELHERLKRVNFYQIVPNQGKRMIRGNKLPPQFGNLLNFGRLRYTPSNDLVWLQYGSNLEVIRPGNEILFTLTDHEPDLKSSVVRGWTTDATGRIWIGGNFGVYVVDLKPEFFSNYLSEEIGLNVFYPNSCRGITIRDDLLITTTEGNGLQTVDLTNGKNEVLDKSEYAEEYLGRALYQDRDKHILIGKNGLIQFDLEKKEAKEINYPPDAPVNHRRIWSIYQDQQKVLWLGAEKGLKYYIPGAEYIEPFTDNGTFEELTNKSFILHIGENREGQIWVCTHTGFYLFGTDRKVIARYWSGGEGAFHLPFENVQHFHQDDDGIYWLATSGSGLVRWDKEKMDVQIFTKSDGLSHNNIYAVYEDKHDHLWLSSDFGIMRFDKKTHEVNTFLPRDGTSHEEFNRISHYQAKDGQLYFGSLNGITSFHPDDFHQEKPLVEAPMIISEFQQFTAADNRLVDRKEALLQSNKIVLQPDDRFFFLEFALLTFENVEKIRYAYKIEGLDKDWNYQKERSIRFSRLPYGKHVLRIKGQAANGGWVKKELKIDIEVLRPFYLKRWFILLSLLLIMASIYAYYKWRTYEYRKKQALLQEEVTKATKQILKDKGIIEQQAGELRQLDKLKSRFFVNVSHELRTPLTLMLGPLSSALKSNKLDPENKGLLSTAKKSGYQLLNLVNEILDLSRLESGKLEVKEHPTLLFSFIRRIVSTFQSHAERHNIYFEFDYQADKYLQLNLDTEKLKKVLNNLLGNAFKFTSNGESIKVTVKDEANHILLIIKDTGRGIAADDLPHIFNRFYQSKQTDSPAEGGTGIGLALCREYAELLNGRLWAESQLGKGSTFYFEFPRKEVLGAIIDADILDVKDQLEESPMIIPNTKPSSDSSRATVLIVEDNHSLREYLQLIMSKHFHVITAENGRVALDLLNRLGNQPTDDALSSLSKAGQSTALLEIDLIVSDVMMPLMDGYQLANIIKSKAHLWHIPMIMLTAKADFHDKIKALRIGVDDYIIKPFEEEELFARMDNLLSNSFKRKSMILEPEEEQIVIQEEASVEPTIIPELSMEDAEWLELLEETILKHLTNFNLTADFLCPLVATSRVQLFRKVKKMTGLTLAQYILEIRLSKARTFLENREYTSVKTVAYAVGLKHVKNFSQQFKKRFGKSPSKYLSN